MNTSIPTGKAILQMMSVIAELERNLLADRVREGINQLVKSVEYQLDAPKYHKKS